MFLTSLLFYFLLSPTHLETMHPLHLSVTNIEYNSKAKTLEISHKIFVDDFKSNIKGKYNINLDTIFKSEDYKIINKYISNNFSVIFNNEKKNTNNKINCKRKELKENCIWFFYDIGCPSKVKSITISNNFLFDLYKDQVNLVILKYNNISKGFDFRTPDDTETFIIE